MGVVVAICIVGHLPDRAGHGGDRSADRTGAVADQRLRWAGVVYLAVFAVMLLQIGAEPQTLEAVVLGRLRLRGRPRDARVDTACTPHAYLDVV
ncbi:hypothetical protein QJS66_12325 [Kocuria rhizophila]|nr:hypothetical protein QJS66_12325 [Kocuria rhizophila]